MPKPDTRQIAERMLNTTPRLIYQQILPKTTPPSSPLKVDELGGGEFEFVGFRIPGSRPEQSFKPRGLWVRTTRPAGLPDFKINGEGITSNIAACRVPPVGSTNELPDEFVVTATFRAPKQDEFVSSVKHPIGPGDHPGEWAAVIVVFTDDEDHPFFAATAQFRDPATLVPPSPDKGVRLNLPATGFRADRPDIERELYLRMTRDEKPETFTLIFHVNRSTPRWKGDAMMFVGEENCYPVPLVPAFPFDFGTFFTSATVLKTIGAGIATGDGGRFNAETEIHEFEIWTKT